MIHDTSNDTKQAIPPARQIDCRKLKTKRHKVKHFDWISDQNHQVRGETALWAAVITQAMMDALSKADNSEANYHKFEAINWLTGNSKNFITVCHHAGLDPDYVRRKAKRALSSPVAWRAEAGKGKRYHERKSYRKRLKPTKDTEPSPTGCTIITGPWMNRN